jgi:hypothetical protein
VETLCSISCIPYPKFHTDPSFGYLLDKAFYLKRNTINLHRVKISTYDKQKNEPLVKNQQFSASGKW